MPGVGLGRLGQQPVLAGAASEPDLLADQVGMALDRRALRRDHHRRLPGIGDGIVDLDGALRRDREDRYDGVDAAW